MKKDRNDFTGLLKEDLKLDIRIQLDQEMVGHHRNLCLQEIIEVSLYIYENKVKLDNQTINSFMDDEDLGKQKLGVNVTIHTDFDTFGNNEINFLQQSLGQGCVKQISNQMDVGICS